MAALVVLAAVGGLGLRAKADTNQTKGELMSQLGVAKESLTGAKESLKKGDYHSAGAQFTVAEAALHHANQTLAEHGQLGGVAGGQASGQIGAGRQLLISAELLAQSGRRLSADGDAIQADFAKQGSDPYKLGEVLVGKLDSLKSDLSDAESRSALFTKTLEASKGSLGGYANQLGPLETAMPEVTDGLKEAKQLTAALPAFLGTDRFKQYLVLFENPAEIRATGGFIGTYGRLTLDNGKLKDLLVDSIYNPANQANPTIKDPLPQPYRRFAEPGKPLATTAILQDANYSPDFPTSAKQFQKYYERSGGPTTDGVIAITLRPFVDILREVGPIDMPEYNYSLSAENFQQLIQDDQSARAAAGDVDPKKILRDFTPKLAAKIGQASPVQKQDVAKIITDAVKTRDLMVYFNDPVLERVSQSLSTDGTLGNGPFFVSAVDTNIHGHKSSTDIDTTYDEQLTVGSDGTVTGQLAISRKHMARTSQDVNFNYTRVFLPDGAKIKDVSGMADQTQVTTDRQDGHTVVGFWTDVEPGQQRSSVVSFELPHRAALATGQLPVTFQKQAGVTPGLKLSVALPPGFHWRSGNPGTVSGQTLNIAETADSSFNQVLRFNE